jgi:hypothetical protein|tara:strand:- start:780 stop:1454 length:675 start_codon:yes stop_codon:yes gene_type:complete
MVIEHDEIALKQVMERNNSLTTGKVAAILNVSIPRVRKWCEEELLKSFFVPSSRFRKVPERSLIDFMKEFDIPLNLITKQGYDSVYTLRAVSKFFNISTNLCKVNYDLGIFKGFRLPAIKKNKTVELRERRILHSSLIEVAVDSFSSLELLFDYMQGQIDQRYVGMFVVDKGKDLPLEKTIHYMNLHKESIPIEYLARYINRCSLGLKDLEDNNFKEICEYLVA